MIPTGSRVVFLDHPRWQGGRYWGYEGIVSGAGWAFHDIHDYPAFYVVHVPWMVKPVLADPAIVCPVYHDCEMCGYAAWGAIETGTDGEPFYHHFCAWCLPHMRNTWETLTPPSGG